MRGELFGLSLFRFLTAFLTDFWAAIVFAFLVGLDTGEPSSKISSAALFFRYPALASGDAACLGLLPSGIDPLRARLLAFTSAFLGVVLGVDLGVEVEEAGDLPLLLLVSWDDDPPFPVLLRRNMSVILP